MKHENENRMIHVHGRSPLSQCDGETDFCLHYVALSWDLIR